MNVNKKYSLISFATGRDPPTKIPKFEWINTWIVHCSVYHKYFRTEKTPKNVDVYINIDTVHAFPFYPTFLHCAGYQHLRIVLRIDVDYKIIQSPFWPPTVSLRSWALCASLMVHLMIRSSCDGSYDSSWVTLRVQLFASTIFCNFCDWRNERNINPLTS